MRDYLWEMTQRRENPCYAGGGVAAENLGSGEMEMVSDHGGLTTVGLIHHRRRRRVRWRGLGLELV